MRALLLVGAVFAFASSASAATPRVLAIHFDNDFEVNPVTQGYVNRQLDEAQKGNYDAAVILLDTPGGLSTSMRKIYQKELGLKIPVIVYVSPNGARAASAGVWIAEAADVLAMAPETNIGSSTPIDSTGGDIKGALGRKIRNDAVASLKSLLEHHGRNPAFARQAVIKATNLTADEALKQHVIDRVAPSLPALLKDLDGYKTIPKGYVLHLAGADIKEVHPGFFTRLLNTLIDRDRLRDLPSRSRPSRSARRRRPGHRTLRLLRAARQLGGPDARPARRRAPGDRPARRQSRRAHRGGAHLPCGRLDHVVPQRAAAVPHLQAARDRDRRRPRRVMGLRRRQGMAGAP